MRRKIPHGHQVLADKMTVSIYFKDPDVVRTTIDTTNAADAVHPQFRKLTKTKDGFANENNFLKQLYAAGSRPQSVEHIRFKTGTRHSLS